MLVVKSLDSNIVSRVLLTEEMDNKVASRLLVTKDNNMVNTAGYQGHGG